MSSEGRVAKLMKHSINPSLGYVQFGFGIRGERVRRYLHELLLTAFVGPRPPGAVARHLNDDKMDNRLENLAWGTRSENQADAFKNAKRKHKEVCTNGHKLIEPNLRGDGGRRCLTCNRARARARHHGVPVTKALMDAVYQEVMG